MGERQCCRLTLTRDALAVLAGVGGAHVILVASEAGVAVRAAAVEVALDVGAGAVGARAWHARVADLASEASEKLVEATGFRNTAYLYWQTISDLDCDC